MNETQLTSSFQCEQRCLYLMSLTVGYNCILQINLVKGQDVNDNPTFLVFIG